MFKLLELYSNDPEIKKKALIDLSKESPNTFETQYAILSQPLQDPLTRDIIFKFVEDSPEFMTCALPYLLKDDTMTEAFERMHLNQTWTTLQIMWEHFRETRCERVISRIGLCDVLMAAPAFEWLCHAGSGADLLCREYKIDFIEFRDSFLKRISMWSDEVIESVFDYWRHLISLC